MHSSPQSVKNILGYRMESEEKNSQCHEEKSTDASGKSVEVNSESLFDVILNEEGTKSEDQAENAEEKTDDWRDKYLRLLAEFDNYKKHASKQLFEVQRYEGERIFRELIEIVDDLERALSYCDQEKIKIDPVLTGVELTYKNLVSFLKRFHVIGESYLNKPFDPAIMEAIEKIDAEPAQEGLVLKELKKVYRFKDKILRYGEVVVGARKEKEINSDNQPFEEKK